MKITNWVKTLTGSRDRDVARQPIVQTAPDCSTVILRFTAEDGSALRMTMTYAEWERLNARVAWSAKNSGATVSS